MSENSSMTITEFLQARIADDERDAKKLAETDRRPVLSLASTINHPQRLLAECAAKRAILEEHAAVRDDGWISGKDHDYLFCGSCGSIDDAPVAYPCATLGIIAAVYADHPDYRQEWAL